MRLTSKRGLALFYARRPAKVRLRKAEARKQPSGQRVFEPRVFRLDSPEAEW